jgi:hypothetical protein
LGARRRSQTFALVDWIIEGDHKRCTRHGTTFGKVDVCPACIGDPGPALEPDQARAADPAALEDERWLRDRRDELLEVARKMTTSATARKSKARVEYSTVAKVYDTALKYHRAAAEERRARGEHDHERWLIKQCRELARRGASN